MDNEPDDDEASNPPGWLDRHLLKIVIAGAVICTLALVGRALTG